MDPTDVVLLLSLLLNCAMGVGLFISGKRIEHKERQITNLDEKVYAYRKAVHDINTMARAERHDHDNLV